MMCGIDQAIKYISECQPRTKGDDMPDRIIDRLRYIRAKVDLDGKRYIYYNCFVEAIAEIE